MSSLKGILAIAVEMTAEMAIGYIMIIWSVEIRLRWRLAIMIIWSVEMTARYIMII